MFKFLRKLFRRSIEDVAREQVETALKEKNENSGEVQLSGNVSMRLNTGLPVSILDTSGDSICSCRINKSTSGTLILGRLPGELKLPKFEPGQEIAVMAYNMDLESVRLRAVVAESSIINLALRQLHQLDYRTNRSTARLPVGREAKIVLRKVGRPDEEIPCEIVDISLTGAHITTEHEMSIGDVVRLRFEVLKNDGVTSANAEVVWATSRDGVRYDYGMLFEEMDGWRRRYLQQSIEDLRTHLERSTRGQG